MSRRPTRGNAPFRGGSNLEDDVLPNVRQRAAAGADEVDQQLRDEGDYATELEEHYRRIGTELYGPLAEGQGGYTPDQIEGIIRQADTEGLQLSEQDKQFWHLRPDEREQILGNPEAAMEFFQPAAERMRGAAGDKADRLREGVGEFKGGLEDTVARATEEFGAAIDADRMRSDPMYRQEVENMLGQTSGNIRGATGSEGLAASDEYMEERGYTDEDVRKLSASGGRRAMANYEDAIQDMEARALASGANPLAIADMRKQMERQASISASDATTDAELKGLGAQKEALQAREDTRLDAEHGRVGLTIEGELGISDAELRAMSDVERQRLQGEQGLTDAQMRRAEQKAGLRFDAATGLADARLDTETSIGDTAVETERFITDVGTGVAEHGEEARTGRQTDIATNRQSTDQELSQEEYTRGLDINTMLSDRNLIVSDEQQAQAKEGREYMVGQQEYQGDKADTAMDQRLESTEIGQAGELGAAGAAINLKAVKQSDWLGPKGPLGEFAGDVLKNVTSVGGGEEGMIITSPTTITAGEDGPEAIVPLKRGSPQKALPPSLASQAGPDDPRRRRKPRQPYSTRPYTGRSPGYGPGDGRMEQNALEPSWR